MFFGREHADWDDRARPAPRGDDLSATLPGNELLPLNIRQPAKLAGTRRTLRLLSRLAPIAYSTVTIERLPLSSILYVYAEWLHTNLNPGEVGSRRSALMLSQR